MYFIVFILSFLSAVTESSCSTLGFIKRICLFPFSLFMTCYDHLSHTLSVFYYKRFVRQIYKYYTYFTPVIGINSARAVQYRYTFLYCKSATWAHLCLISFRQSYIKACRNKTTLKRLVLLGYLYWHEGQDLPKEVLHTVATDVLTY